MTATHSLVNIIKKFWFVDSATTCFLVAVDIFLVLFLEVSPFLVTVGPVTPEMMSFTHLAVSSQMTHFYLAVGRALITFVLFAEDEFRSLGFTM